jgi:AcrR family transcriptional regulator
MPGDAQATRKRLLDAAKAEFAERGIAGARVDRIAAAANANKAQIYHYFGSKDDLFDAVFDQLVTATTDQTPLDAADLPGYAAGLFDRYEDDADIARLATWYRLERSSSRPPHALRTAASKEKVARIRAAQQAGALSTTFAAEDLLALITTVAAIWTRTDGTDHGPAQRRSRTHRRQVIIDAIRALLAA